jgi:hypothetical protein
MDVKSAFLNWKISELVYVEEPPGFEDPTKPNHMYKLSKALYGLKQAPRAWYERLRDFLLSKSFKIGKVDTTLFTKKIGIDIFSLFVKFMLMILYLVQQMKIFVKNLEK